MLKKVVEMLASKYLAIKGRIRAIETHVMIQSLLLRDKKMIRHLFRHGKCLNLSNKVKADEGEDRYQSESNNALINGVAHDDEGGDNLMEINGAHTNGSVATAPCINNWIATAPVSVVQVAMGEAEHLEEDEDEYPDLRHTVFEDEEDGGRSVSVIEMVKNVKERRGKKFVLEEDIDKVADLFIQRFHHQVRLQKRHSEED